MVWDHSVPFPTSRSPLASSDSLPYHHSRPSSRSSLFLTFDRSDSEEEDNPLASSHSLASFDSGYFSIMGKNSPNSKHTRKKQHKADLRFPLTPLNSVEDITPESPKRESTLRSLLRKTKKSLTATTVSSDTDPYALLPPVPLFIRDDVEPITRFRSPSPRANLRDTPGQVFRPEDRLVIRQEMKHHPYSHDDAPYMQAYDRVLLDSDRFAEILLRRLNINHSPSFHDCFIHTAPRTILDLGCGAGGWAVEAAEFWPTSQVIGFDLVDPVRLRGSAESPSNIQWRQGNFVKNKLPFPKNMFDLVRMANLSLCVPYERWEYLLSEVRRVLAQGGRLELIDDYLYFPYTKRTPQPSSGSRDSPRPQRSSSLLDFENDGEYDDEALLGGGDIEMDNEDEDDFMSTKSHLSSFEADQLPTRLAHDPILDWSHNIDNSKSLETLYEEMLSKQFSIHPRPSKFIDTVMDKVFGRYNQSKLQEFNVYLAPPPHRDSDHSSGSSESPGNTGIKKAGKELAKWMTTERDHLKEKEWKPRKSSDRSSGEDPNPFPVPGNISAKAAGRLGIAANPPHAPPQSHNSSHTSQSPGLVVWPSTFIPVPPLELEMHACRHLHSLLGCKAALMDFIEDIAQRRKLPFDEQLVDDLIWDYESFRRKRFNWPSDCPDLETPDSTTPRLTAFRPSIDELTPTQEHHRVTSFGTMSPPFDPLFPREKLDFIRSIRVYSATKHDEDIHIS